MRMWNIEPKYLCQKHLCGEHLEMHMFAGTIIKGKNIDGYIQTGLVEVGNIKRRHDELVKEMKARGFNHKSPLADFEGTISAGNVNVEENMKELRNRCKECGMLQINVRRIKDGK